jgi:hypothetical protein
MSRQNLRRLIVFGAAAIKNPFFLGNFISIWTLAGDIVHKTNSFLSKDLYLSKFRVTFEILWGRYLNEMSLTDTVFEITRPCVHTKFMSARSIFDAAAKTYKYVELS